VSIVISLAETPSTRPNRTPEAARNIDFLQQTPENPRTPWTPPKATGNKKVDRANRSAFKRRRNRIIDLITAIRREEEARDKHKKQASRKAAEVERRLTMAKRRDERERRRQELERELSPKQRLTRTVKERLKELGEEAYRLLPAITETIQRLAMNNVPKHSYNHIIMDEVAQMSMEEQRKYTQAGVRYTYSDGSMVNFGKARCSMAFAVVGEQQPVIQGTTKGFASSVKSELMGLIAGIIATPQDQDVCIRLDNQEVVKKFNDIVINRRRQ
jgi:hypothetical protein